MRKIILGFIFSLCMLFSSGQQVLNVNGLTLANSGSVTITLDQTTQLYWAYQGTYNLTGNLSIISSGTPLIGTQFTIWFDSTTINIGASHHVFIFSQDFTSLLSGTQNLFITFTYNGVTWTSQSIDATILSYLASYATLAQVNDSLGGYVDTASLSSTLGLYAPITGPIFLTKAEAPIVGNSDSSANISTTAGTKRLLNSILPSTYATITYTNSAISTSISSATSSITSAYTSAISTSQATNQHLATLDTLAAGTISLTTYVGQVFNKIEPYIITGNIVLTSGVLSAGAVSTIVIELPFSGSYTVTAGANMNFTTITGANTHTSVLVLTWSDTQQRYNQESFSQN